MYRTLVLRINRQTLDEDGELAVKKSRRKTEASPDDGDTTESSHQWTDFVESETREESEVRMDVGEMLTATVMEKASTDKAEM